MFHKDFWFAVIPQLAEKSNENRLKLLRNCCAWLGLCLLLVSVLATTQSAAFPGWWAILPTLGTFLFIVAGPAAFLNRKFLSSRTAVFIGIISYPLYLWHWPLLTFAKLFESKAESVALRCTVLFCSVLLAYGTYKLVETPLRGRSNTWHVPVALLVVLGLIGGMGFLIHGKSSQLGTRLASNTLW